MDGKVLFVSDSIQAVMPVAGSGGGDTDSMLFALIGSVVALSLCAYLIFSVNRKRKLRSC